MGVRRILLPWDSQPQEPTGVNRDWPYADGLIFAATGGLPDAVGGYLPSLIGSTGFSAGVDGVSFDSTSTSSQGWFYTLPSNHPLYSITTVVTIVQIVEIDSWGSYGCLLSVPHAAGSWSSPFDAMGIQKNAANNQIRLWGSSTEHVCTLTVTTGRNVLGVTRSAGNSVFYVNGTTQAAVGNSGAYDFTNKQPICLMQRSNSSNGEGADGRSPLLLIFNKFYSEAQLRDIVQTAWQAFAPRFIPVPVSAGGGAPTLALTGYAATGSAGILVPALSLAVAGNGATAAQGTATPSLSKAITGNAVTASAGTPVASISLALTGNAATASVGTVGIGGTTQALTGNAATASAGTPVAVISLALTGNGATSSVGTATPALSKAITGNAATTAVGTPVAGLSLALSGNGATSACGTVEVPGVIVPSSSVATTAAGTVTPGISIALTGNGATASVGSVSPAISLALSGLAGTSSAGIVIPGLSLALSGNAAAADTGTIAVATGDATVALTGNLATAYAGSLGIGGAVGLSAWWRYDVPVNDMRYAVPVHNLRYDVDTENLT